MPPEAKRITLEDTEPFSSSLARLEKAKLKSVNVGEFIQMKLKPRQMILNPVIPEKGLAMAYAPRGIGKTFFGLSIAYAAASGGKFLCWEAPKPRRVLYLDGEMPAVVMQERLSEITLGLAADIATPDNFKIITPDLQDYVSPDISSKDGQEQLGPHLDGVDLLVIDNLASLCRSGDENERNSWLPVQSWLLELRKQGKSALLIHHAGKGGKQRGASAREDVLDTVMALRSPSDYLPEQGARFEIHFEKSRGIHGDDVKPMEAQLEVREGAAQWSFKQLQNVQLDRVITMSRDGMTVRDIAEEIGVSKSTVHRMITRAKAEGQFDDADE